MKNKQFHFALSGGMFLTALIIFYGILGMPSYAQGGKLRFHEGKFKIVQFTDLHWIEDAAYAVRNDSTYRLMEKVVRSERPDLVVLTGDVVVSRHAIDAWRRITSLFEKEKTPFAVAFGNHDEESDMNNAQILSFLRTQSYNRTRDEGKGRLSGSGNCALPIYAAQGHTPRWMLYLFDSHNLAKDSTISYYDWIHADQIAWYRYRSQQCTRRNGGHVLPSLAFFHIPFPEFTTLRSSSKKVGTQDEEVCCPQMNSGLFTAFLEQKDVIGVFVGHDHNNDYLLDWHGRIALAYGRKTGYNAAYKETLPRGARIIVLQEDGLAFDTWIYDEGGTHHPYTMRNVNK
jgi:3',5'-cyclic AMP phosphodiesterase CpdA